MPDVFVSTGTTPWVATGHLTPAHRYWGLAHQKEPLLGSIFGSWVSIGLGAFGNIQAPETRAPPYGFTHMLETALPPRSGSFADAHGSTIGDDLTPLDKDGVPLLRDAWRYMLGAKDEDEDDQDATDGPERPFGW